MIRCYKICDGDEEMKDEDVWELEYKKLLNKKDPLDKQILELTKKGELDINIVELKEEIKKPSEKYSHNPYFTEGNTRLKTYLAICFISPCFSDEYAYQHKRNHPKSQEMNYCQ